MALRIPSVKLNNGHNIPVIGLGTFKALGQAATQAVQHAIEVGYRHIDCAYLHFNEHDIGKGVQSKIDSGFIERDDLYLVSKVWNTSHQYKHVIKACRETLQLLNTSYLDLYLIQWPVAFKEGTEPFPFDDDGHLKLADTDYLETWRGLEDCCYTGLVKSIGLSNFNSEQIDRILSVCKIRPVVNQIECNPNINQKEMIQFCKDREIIVSGYCPLGLGTEAQAEHPDAPNSAIFDGGINDIASKHNKTSAQVCLRYLYQNNVVVLPKAVKKSHIRENIDIFDFELDEDDMGYIDSVNKNARIITMDIAKNHKYYPF